MSVEEWIGALISLLGLAMLAFFNQPKESQRNKETPSAALKKKSDQLERKLETLVSAKEKPKKHNNHATNMPNHHETPPVKLKKAPQKPTLIKRLIVDDSDELTSNRIILKSSKVQKLQPISSIRAEFQNRSPQIRTVVKDLKNLKNLIICREIMERNEK